MHLWRTVLLCFLLLAGEGYGGPRLVGWGAAHPDPERGMQRAAEVGFKELYLNYGSGDTFRQQVEAGQRHGVAVYGIVSPTQSSLGKLWKARFPEVPFPEQVLTPEQESAARLIAAGENRTPYQWGGEPLLEHEVLLYPIVCPNNPQARRLLKERVAEILSTPGVAGVALDGFGYRNFFRCHCEGCVNGLARFAAERPELQGPEAEVAYFRDVLVGWINELAAHARACRADARTSIHIWPAFMPEPLYGNRLDVDACGQTAAWYTLWPQEKIARYSRIIMGEAKRYHSRPEGVAMLGYYNKPGVFPEKDAARVEMELRTLLENGCHEIQVCGTRDVVEKTEIAAIFRRIFATPQPPK